MIKVLCSLLLFLSINSAQASNPLFINDEVFHMVSLISDSRYDYESGVEIRLRQSRLNFYAPEQAEDLSFCKRVKSKDLVNEMSIHVDKFLSSYGDHEYDFELSLDIFSNIVNSHIFLNKCVSGDKISYYSLKNEFLVSYKY